MSTRVRREGAGSRPVGSLADPLSDSDLGAFYRSVFLPLVRRAVWKHRLPPEDARDIVQDAFVLAVARLRGNGNPRAWLIQVVDHLAINFRRKVMRRASLTQRWMETEAGKGASRGDIEDHIEES